MIPTLPQPDQALDAAVAAASDTRGVWLGGGALACVAEAFRTLFTDTARGVVVADETTYEVAGRDAERALRGAGMAAGTAHVFPGRPGGRLLHADYEHAEWLRGRLGEHDAVPVAVGSGTVNDLTKLAAHLVGRPYMVVATAASMDGYAAFGAAMTRRGFKQTMACPAPRGVVGDTDILAAAPQAMTASGFGDLAGKIPAGADWLLADAVGVEPVDPAIWDLVQPAARRAMGAAEGVRRGEGAAVAELFRCLVMSGLAMQAARSSRPASGAEHQLSHLWEMRGVTAGGRDVSHGFKVGVGTVLATALYERVLAHDVAGLDVAARLRDWPSLDEQVADAEREHGSSEVREQVLAEVRAKYIDAEALGARLERVRAAWPALRERLRAQLLPLDEVRRALRAAGCPVEPHEIGLTAAEAARSMWTARQIRRRYTVLDVAAEIGLLEMAGVA
ncbi:MAG TPA: sn-glycerol-1-phosphate dehydrogenase [Chloroflexota bacterium]|nr:sn-glycerol-1-phosphate dehydrogenase [Chloroflexota bacterium]